MKTFKDISEARGDTAVFTFGRFNPPTIGHEKLLDKTAAVAKKNAGAPYYIFASHSENPKKDPLPYSKKIAYMKKMFPKHSRNLLVSKARNVFEIAMILYNKGHKSIVMVAGSDRVAEFEGLLNKYNGVEARHGYYGFDNIEVISAGERDPDAEGVTGMSASKMRAAASTNDFDQFKLGLPTNFKQGMTLFKDVRRYMGIRESFIPVEDTITEEEIFRDLYIRGEILTIGEEVTDSYSGVCGKIVRRGTNYITFAEENGDTHKKWLYEIQEMTTGQLIKRVMAKTTKKKGYDRAVEIMKSVIDRKHKESGGKLKHGISYYAQQIARTLIGIDGKELGNAFTKAHPKLTEENPCWDTHKQVGMKKKNGKMVPNCVPKEEFVAEKEDKDIGKRKGTQPAKYYAKDAEGDKMAKSTKQARARHFAKGSAKDDSDDSAYKPAPGDKSAKTKPSKYTNKMKKMFPDLYKEKAPDTQDAMKRYKAGKAGFGDITHLKAKGLIPRSDGTKRKSDKYEDAREIGTNARRELHQDMTPGQKVIKFSEHTNCGTPDCCNECETSSLIESNIYRVGSEKYFEFFQEKRDAYQVGVYEPVGFDKQLMEGDLGRFDMYQGQHVALDCPMMFEEKDVELNKPKVGGPKKYYVYVKDPKTGNVKKVTFGDTSGLKVKLSDKEARKSFAARHNCDQQKDRTKAGYWSCNLPRYAKQLGLSGGGNFFW